MAGKARTIHGDLRWWVFRVSIFRENSQKNLPSELCGCVRSLVRVPAEKREEQERGRCHERLFLILYRVRRRRRHVLLL